MAYFLYSFFILTFLLISKILGFFFVNFIISNQSKFILGLKCSNIFFTTLHPQILSKISSRLVCYARTNVMIDVFKSKVIDCSEYKKVDLNKNNGQTPGNYGYGVIYVNPRKKNFKKE